MKKLAVHVVLDDGTVLDAETRTADYVAYEAEARKRGWGGVSDSPSSWEAFVSYRALSRTRAISMPFDAFLAAVDEPLGPRDAVCVLTHDAKFDVPAIVGALATDVGYVGAMGSRRTHAARLARLREEGIDEAALARVMAPIGLDIGAEAPAEVAISILAEMIQVRYGAGSGRSLRGREGRIHRQRTDDEGDI